MKSSENASSERKPPKTTPSTSEPSAACTASLKQDYWPTLKKCLNKHRYQQSKLVPGLWKHNTRPIQFTLVVNDFGIKYIGKEHAQNLKNALKEHYKLTCDWTGK